MQNPPVSLSLALAADANSGLQGNIRQGDANAGAAPVPLFVWLIGLGVVLLLGTAFILGRNRRS